MRAVLAAGLVVLLGSGCAAGGSPQAELAERVDAVTVAANERDADGLRDAALALADTASAQRDAQKLPADRAQELIALATTLRERADVLDPDVQARLEAERDAEQARREAAAERTAREEAEREAREAAEREAAEQAAQAEREAERKAAEDKGKKGRQQDAAEEAAEDAQKDAEKAADEAEDEAEEPEEG